MSTCSYVLSSQAVVAGKTLQEHKRGDIIETGGQKVMKGLSEEVRSTQPSDLSSELGR